jgi:hypothetical protein
VIGDSQVLLGSRPFQPSGWSDFIGFKSAPHSVSASLAQTQLHCISDSLNISIQLNNTLSFLSSLTLPVSVPVSDLARSASVILLSVVGSLSFIIVVAAAVTVFAAVRRKKTADSVHADDSSDFSEGGGAEMTETGSRQCDWSREDSLFLPLV